jgi:histidinol dehydrogenase
LAAAGFLGAREFYRVGGAQAIAALAYGTESMPRVDKIVGPGNRYVVSAKKLVAFDCAIDFVAGPTEVVIFSEDGNPAYIAADLVAQAEHDPDAVAVFITASRSLARAVSVQVRKQSRSNAVAEQALERNGLIVIASSREEALHLTNRFAPEHLTVGRDDVAGVNCAGSVFVGDYSPQAVGDYASGPNHVLPTGGAARFRGGLSVLDFVKLISIQELSLAGLREIAPTVQRLAEAEGLRAHAESVRVRCASA